MTRMAGNPAARNDPVVLALGYLAATKHYLFPGSSGALSSQVIFASVMWIPPGVTIANVVMHVMGAGSGAQPTGFFVGIASPTKMLAQSNNLNASALLTAIGTAAFALNGSYTTSYADSPKGLYYGVVLQNGAFGGTNVTFGKNGAGGVGNGAALAGQSPIWGTLGTVQTALPGNGAAITFTENTGNAPCFAVS